ncbi:permease [Pseudalkalibacillus salsuginis]|uniref:permease n=1 Tax=Pseudalkalibacillus salsuginis TaxID=2910972 RepID=UPI001F33A6A8|nr:permease [Pseudalkalibacillus salsuginis]MCF6411217.1 permease [Pseudalkalibacillus salsuginis]
MFQQSTRENIMIFLLFFLFLFGFLFIEEIKSSAVPLNIPGSLIDLNTIFLSIVLEAFPFLLLGVFVSAIIQSFVSEETIKRFTPKKGYIALVPATVMAALFPVCECAIIPVVRRLIKKGMPLHIGVVFLVAAPILNPVVFLSTFYAFRSDMTVVYARMGLGFILAIVIGGIIYTIFKNKDMLKIVKTHTHAHNHGTEPSKWKMTMYHMSDEFFDTGKYLLFGALLASSFQAFVSREFIASIGTETWSSSLIMMGFAYLVSLCSEADAFVAVSFQSTFSTASIVAFLVYGPMLDIKNTLMLLAYFKKKFVLTLMLVITVTVFIAILLFQLLFL